MKFVVRAESNNFIRDEIIDTEINVLFSSTDDYKTVAKRYQAFWDMDKYDPKVTILGVMPVKSKVKPFKGDAKVIVTVRK